MILTDYRCQFCIYTMYISGGAIFSICTLVNSAFGARLQSCANGRLPINEQLSTNDILCDQLDTKKQTSWVINGHPTSTLGFCETDNSCIPYIRNDFNISRSGGSSTLSIAQSQYSKIGNYSITCADVPPQGSVPATCDLNVVYPSDVKCSSRLISGNWTLSLSCDVTKTYSSRDTYWCTAYRGTTQDNQTILIGNQTYSTTPDSQTPYRKGTCSFSINNLSGVTSVPSDSQIYFRVDVYPGPTSVGNGPTNIQRPALPTIACPVIVENSPFTCNCTTHNIGQPPGCLQWSGPASVSATGNYGDSSLNTPRITLTRQNVTRLTCEVIWAEGTYRQNYMANVSYKAENLTLNINGAIESNVTVNENDSVSFTCQANAMPVATVVLEKDYDDRPEIRQSPLVYRVGGARCQDTGLYKCSASNTYGQSNNMTQLLLVKCSPRSVSTDLGNFNYQNKSIQIIFAVTAYPLPSNFSFAYTGTNGTDSPQTITNIDLSASCTSASGFNTFNCSITVSNVTSPTAQGHYVVTVRNIAGQQNYNFYLLYNGPIPPEIKNDVKSGGINAAAVGGGIGGAVVALLVVIVIVVIVLRRKNASPDKERLNGSIKNDNGNHNKSQGLVNPPEQPLSFTPCALQNAGDQQYETHQQADHAPHSSNDQHKKPQKTKPADKAKLKKKNNKGAKEEDAVHVYGNMPLTQQKMKQQPPQDSATGKPKPKTEGDGLIYSELDFQGKPSAQPPVHKDSETVIYSDIKTSVTVNAHNA